MLFRSTDGGGVSRYDGKSFTNYTTAQGLANNSVISITEDKSGNLWFGTFGGGVSRYDGKSFTNYTTAQGLANNVVRIITEDKSGNLWFGTDGGGVSRYDGKSFTNYTTVQGLANNVVRSIAEDKSGNLWFGTYGGGVSRYDGQSFTNYTTENGLPDNVVTQIVIDEQENIVIGTNFGVAVVISFTPKFQTENTNKNIPSQNSLHSEDLKNYTPVIEIYNSKTGYPVKDVNVGQNAMYKDSKGIIWIATGSDKTSLVCFDPSEIKKNNKPPDLFIQSVKINEENICFYNFIEKDSAVRAQQEVMTYGRLLNGEARSELQKKFGDIKFDGIAKWYPLPENLVLPYNHNNVTFDFIAIETGRNFLVRYQYILEGYDNEWSPLTEKTSATFGNIHEGTYTFRLKARSPEGIWSKPTTYTFKVLPPWWRTWWMYSVYILSLTGAIVLIVLWNGRRLRVRAKELAGEVRRATVIIVEQKKVVEEKNKEITDSINYAKRIQQAKLPSIKEIQKALPESFVLFKPKDIVSGDFYYFHKNSSPMSPSARGIEGEVFIASADCTGHGVPGAFMSMIGSEKLDDALAHSADTSEILSHLNKGIKSSLRQTGSDESTRDGMDIALCSLTTGSCVIKYAGANRPLWIVRNGSTAVEEIKATKKAIGGLTEDSQHFETHIVQLQRGDTFYISTDGYADTFGGKENKKITTKKFKEVLLSIQDKSMQDQELYLDNFVENWKAGTEQVDDILVIGVRL